MRSRFWAAASRIPPLVIRRFLATLPASTTRPPGFRALYNNITGRFNTATGLAALLSNTNGNSNTANGVGALQDNTTGFENKARGETVDFSWLIAASCSCTVRFAFWNSVWNITLNALF